MIDKSLVTRIKDKTKLKKSRVYELIKAKQKSLNFVVSTEQAAVLVAGELGIDVSKVIPREELEHLHGLIAPGKPHQTQPETEPTGKSTTSRTKSVVAQVRLPNGTRVTDPLMPQTLVDDAVRMTNVYLMIYLFENSVRNLVRSVLEKKYGPTWWDLRAPKTVDRDARNRMKQEKEKRWHGKRGAHPIFYTQIGDLESIISANWQDLSGAIGESQPWVKVKIEEIERSRNVVAHNNPLRDDDIKRLELNFRDWIRQIGTYEEADAALPRAPN